MATQTGSIDLKGMTSAYSDQQQYFWVESSSSATWGGGAHITNVAESAFKTAAGTWGTNPTAGGYNLLMNTDTANATGSLQLRNGSLPIMNLDNDSLDFNIIDSTTTPYTSVTIATFGISGARIGSESGAHSVIDSNGHRFYASDGTTQLANIGYGAGSSAAGVVTNAPYYTFGTRKSPTNDYSASSTYKIGDMCWHTTNGVRRPYICDTPITTPEAWTSEHWLLAIGNESFAEGRDVVAAHLTAHAEGIDTIALGGYSHAEGGSSKAYGYISHAEGQSCIASGRYSHAQNNNTIASKDAQTVIGRFNLEDTSDTDAGEYAFIIGNGTAGFDRSNAFTVGWNGNVMAQGGLTLNGNMPLADYIVDTGEITSGNSTWIWYKYYSGLVRAWYNSGATTTTVTTSSGNGWYRNESPYTISLAAVDSAVGGLIGINYCNVVCENGLAYIIVSIADTNSTFISYYVSHLGTYSNRKSYITAEIVSRYL